VPVVATNVPGIRDIVTHERTGLLVPPGSPLQLADAIQRMEEDKALTNRMVANAAAEVRERYTWGRVMEQYRQLLAL
jgi:glycosyltransferase involved in cell wall biosynthesis